MNFKYGIPTVSRRDFLKGGTLGLALAGAAALAGCDNGGEQASVTDDGKNVGIAVSNHPRPARSARHGLDDLHLPGSGVPVREGRGG